MGEHRPGMKPERSGPLVVDAHPGDIGRQKIRGELDAVTGRLQRRRDAAGQRGLAQPRNVLDEQVPASEQAGQRQRNRLGLAPHHQLDVVDDGLKRRREIGRLITAGWRHGHHVLLSDSSKPAPASAAALYRSSFSTIA